MATDPETDAVEPRYRAPALGKGLDILELLARTPEGLNLTGIVQRLGRSNGELFRMVQVLQHRGYIDQPIGSGEFQLTDKLFSLGMEQPRTRNLVEAALPVMRQLSLDLGQSCHLALHSQGEMVVIARMESANQIGFSVRVGYRRTLLETGSGRILLAFQPDDVQAHWRTLMQPPPADEAWRATLIASAKLRTRGWTADPSMVVEVVRDVATPILRDDRAAAALTVPYLVSRGVAFEEKAVATRVLAAAEEISALLARSDSRV